MVFKDKTMPCSLYEYGIIVFYFSSFYDKIQYAICNMQCTNQLFDNLQFSTQKCKKIEKMIRRNALGPNDRCKHEEMEANCEKEHS